MPYLIVLVLIGNVYQNNTGKEKIWLLLVDNLWAKVIGEQLCQTSLDVLQMNLKYHF